MARTELDRTVQPSLLDRLTDRDPRTPADPPISREESVRRFRNSVLRDVEWLLNTRRTPETVPEGLSLVSRSVFTYGLPDTTGIAMGSRVGRELLVRRIEQTLATFEPRLADVQVTLTEADQIRSPQVLFAITALLRMDPSPEQVVFDTVFDLASGGYAVRPQGATP
ncbi:MAG TPA: type VI secretion system baseplate subunit TssE [Gemmatirosa sp.]